ncbi:MAG: pyridoxamine 5'-phosphate oxidase [Gammaproteobacteria bacterium]
MSEHNFGNIRRTYTHPALSLENISRNPFEQFNQWFQAILKIPEILDPTAMVLATVDKNNQPETRIVLLKEIYEEQFLFYTNYQSQKGDALAQHPVAALNFYWPQACRQVRVRGKVAKAPEHLSDQYFHERPHASQIAAVASPQSTVIEKKTLIKQFKEIAEKYKGKEVPRPKHWGGYLVSPFEFEFWQGGEDRLHDRIRYILQKGEWGRQRLAP